MGSASEVDSPRPAKKPSVVLTLVVLVVCVYLTVVVWTMCGQAMNVRSNIMPLLGMIGFPMSVLGWFFVVRWIIKRHRRS